MSLPCQSRARGFALISVLALVALALVLVVALLSSSDTGVKAASLDADQARARWTADNAINMAAARLMTATTQQFADGTPMPWTSQPGAIRVHEMDGSQAALYKLYTAADMGGTTGSAPEDDVPENWQQHPDEFADLNAPLVTSTGGSTWQMRFPIVDPRTLTSSPATSVEGFDYAEVKGAAGPRSGAESQRLPMPVRWVYMFRDGSMTTLDDTGRLAIAHGRDNPIVARFAWWVDDESCKVNINTAAEGAFWDTPRADTSQERNLASSPPTRLEYHRQPGHPAGVCLSSVLLPRQRLYPEGFAPAASDYAPMSLEDALDLWKLGRLQVADAGQGTSWAGTRTPDWELLWPAHPAPVPRQPRYSMVDELVFDNREPEPKNSQRSSTGGQTRPKHSFFLRHPELLERLSRASFFLTADSAAPEVTLYGTPRIALWPVHANSLLGSSTGYDSCYDHKLALVSTCKEKPWFIQRADPANASRDFDLLGGGANKALHDYLKRLTDMPVPGFFKPSPQFTTFDGKYGDDRDAILMEMIDYLRTCNGADGQIAADKQFALSGADAQGRGAGQIGPLRQGMPGDVTARGLGRLLTVSEIALVFSCRAEVDEHRVLRGDPTDANRTRLVNPGDREIEISFLVEAFVPGQGCATHVPRFGIALAGGPPGAAPDRAAPLPKFRINRFELSPNPATSVIKTSATSATATPVAGGGLGVRVLPQGVLSLNPLVLPAGANGKVDSLKFFGNATADANQLKLAVYDSPDDLTEEHLLQVIPLELPDIQPSATNPGVPVPTLPNDSSSYPIAARVKCSAETGAPLFSSGDVVQSLVPVHGDCRLLAGQERAEVNGMPVFVAHPQWGSQQFAHTLRDSVLPAGASPATGFFSDLPCDPATVPDLPVHLTVPETSLKSWKAKAWTTRSAADTLKAFRLDNDLRGDALPDLTGDFDNGMGATPDGPYLNRPDDGDWRAALTGNVPYFDPPAASGGGVPEVTNAAFSAQRLLPSPVMFGSLPTGVRAQVPWQTLLFRPQPGHYGASSPPDHLLLDLFWSPVLEPEMLSQPFETAGKINLNHVFVPFGYIHRTTALHAAMKAETLMAIPDSAAATYKSRSRPDDQFRHYIDAAKTIQLWQKEVFDQSRVFLTPGQVCEQYLVPEGAVPPEAEPSTQIMQAWWQSHRLTGDNSKERPYAHLYSRLTTRSNVFRVHFIAQALKKSRSVEAASFDSKWDRITASVQGSCLIRRQLDDSNPDIPDYLAAPESGVARKPLDAFYRWSVGPVETFR